MLETRRLRGDLMKFLKFSKDMKILIKQCFGRPFVKRFALCYQTVVCLSVMLVHCGQRVGWIKIKLGLQVSLGPGQCHIVLDGGPSSPPSKGHSPPIFGPYLLQPNGCMDEDVTWYGARPRRRRLCVTWGPSPLPKKGAEPLPNFRPNSIVVKWLDGPRCHLVRR